jgi:hypothetical protein
MAPVILIIESRREVAEALGNVVTSAHYQAVIRPRVESLTDLELNPAAIIVRIAFEGVGEPAHAAVARFGRDRPPVVAIAWAEDEIAEAVRLECDVVLRAPEEVGRLCDVLRDAVSGAWTTPCAAVSLAAARCHGAHRAGA